MAQTGPVARLCAWLTYPAWATLLAVLLFSVSFPHLAQRWQFWPFVVGMVFLGLPHGALDHLAPLFLLQKRLTVGYLTIFVLGYGALVALYLVFWRFFPLPALAVFLLCSWLHWGQGDAYFLDVFGGQPAPKTRLGRFLIWAVRGGLPILLPPLAYPAAFAAVTGGILRWYGGGSGWTLSEPVRVAGLGVLGLATAAYLWQSWRLDRSGFWRDAGEIFLLLAYFLLVPPIFAVGVYFCVWHSARHLARLMLLDGVNAGPLALGQVGRCALRSAAEALPMTLGALGLLAGLFWWQGRAHVGVGGFVFLYLSLIAALTFPHFLLVLWMDRQESAGRENLAQNGPNPVVIGGRRDLPGNSL